MQRYIGSLRKRDGPGVLTRPLPQKRWWPQGEDLDSLLRKNPVAVFETILREAKDYTRHLLDVACEQEDITSPRGRGLVAAKLAGVIAKIPNAVQKETFRLEGARRRQDPRDAIEEAVRKAEAQQRSTERQQRE